MPAFAAGHRPGQDVMAAHVGPDQASFPVSIVWLFVVGLLFAGGVWLTTSYWL